MQETECGPRTGPESLLSTFPQALMSKGTGTKRAAPPAKGAKVSSIMICAVAMFLMI
jgi:hypothetical protein